MTSVRRVLIDNATLSGVERIMGISKTINLNNVENDIVCLEKLVTAILFSDELVGIDDYKDEFRSSRLKNFEFVTFSRPDEQTYSALANEAAGFARSMSFSFDGSKPVGDIVHFFEALQIDSQLRWDVWVSSEYLTLCYLVADPKSVSYETSVDTILRNELTDSRLVETDRCFHPTLSVVGRPEISDVKELVQALYDENPNSRGADGKSALQRMVFGYGWAAERSYFYNAVAQMWDSDAYLAPMRDAFCESCCRIDYPSQVNGLLDALAANSQRALAAILEPTGQAKFALRLPFFTAYLISETDNPKQCIELALSLRDTRDFQECRTILANLNHLSSADRTQELNRILKFLDQSCCALMKKYAVSTSGGLQISLSIGLAGINLGIGSKLDQLFRRYNNAPFARVFRNVAQDMLNVERLGRLFEKVSSSVVEHRDATYSAISKTPRFMEHRESAYGRPAKL